MPDITTFLTFNNQAEEAVRFYTSVSPNSRITQVAHYPDLGPEFGFAAGSVMTVAFELLGRGFRRAPTPSPSPARGPRGRRAIGVHARGLVRLGSV